MKKNKFLKAVIIFNIVILLLFCFNIYLLDIKYENSLQEYKNIAITNIKIAQNKLFMHLENLDENNKEMLLMQTDEKLGASIKYIKILFEINGNVKLQNIISKIELERSNIENLLNNDNYNEEQILEINYSLEKIYKELKEILEG